MTCKDYLAEALRLYLDQPDTPKTPSRADWAVAADLFHHGVDFDLLAHAIRLATLRRNRRCSDAPPLEPIRSLAYYRRVLASLTREDLDPSYVAYVDRLYQRLIGPAESSDLTSEPKARSDHQKTAVHDRR